MSAQSAVQLPFFTDEILTKNFMHINDALTSTTKLLTSQGHKIADLEGWLFSLEKDFTKVISATAKASEVVAKAPKKRSILVPVLIGVGIGLYISRNKTTKVLVDDAVDKIDVEDLRDKVNRVSDQVFGKTDPVAHDDMTKKRKS